VKKPLQEPRISDRFDEFIEKLNLKDEWKPRAYLQQIKKIKDKFCYFMEVLSLFNNIALFKTKSLNKYCLKYYVWDLPNLMFGSPR
jgi:hypothetical protein